jgi:soluble lytic murein transglycosylase-like protein
VLLVQGFLASACGVSGLAVERLGAGAAGELDDWRLWALARSATAAGRPRLALHAIDDLLREHAGSALAPAATLEAARLAHRLGQPAVARARIDEARALALVQAERAELENLAWEIAVAQGDRSRQLPIAKFLLVEIPLDASRLRVADRLRRTDGSLPWSEIFTVEQLETRARHLLDVELAVGALSTLDPIPPGRRGALWYALRAEAMAQNGQGREAMGWLRQWKGAGTVELDWAKAEAASEALSTRRGRKPLPAAERQRLAVEKRDALWSVASAGGARAESALRRLYREAAAANSYDEALRALAALRALGSRELLGARYLWGAAWEEFRAGRAAQALDRWTQLATLYPESRYSRSGHYWSGRSYEKLGRPAEAQGVFSQIAAADTLDFYRQQALKRLSGAAPAPPETTREAWPALDSLRRAGWFSDLGMDEFALEELDAVERRALAAGIRLDGRATTALRGLILARKGSRRESLRLLANAFPELGSANQARIPEQALKLYYPLDFEPTVQNLARAQGLSPALVFGMIHQESGFDHKAVSHAGARGLMQLMPATAREVSRRLGLRYSLSRLSEPEFSVQLGTSYFRQVLGMFGGTVEAALAGYNAGPSRIRRLWTARPAEIDTFIDGLSPEEPKIYVKRILAISDSYRQLYPGHS